MLSIGLTGGIGSGKTAVSDIFGTLGVPVIDTDLIARELVEPGQPALTAIVECFGPACLTPDKRLNRAYLRQCIFTDPIAKKNLENILHPRIRTEVARRISQLSVPYCIVVIPLLVEINASNAAYALDRILVVDVPEDIQIERVMSRDNISKEHAIRILQSQASRQRRLANADDIILNTGSLTQLRQKIDELHQYYLELATNTNC